MNTFLCEEKINALNITENYGSHKYKHKHKHVHYTVIKKFQQY